MVSPVAPWPATTGGLVRIASLLTEMAQHFDVTFASPREAGQRLPRDLPVRFLCPEVPGANVVGKLRAAADPTRPYHAALYDSARVRQAVRQAMAEERFALIYSHFLYPMEYLPNTAAHVIIDSQNVDRVYWQNKADHSSMPLSAFARWNKRRTMAYESRLLPRIWAYVSVSDEDREQTRAYAGARVKHFWVAPNGVDVERFAPAERVEQQDAITLGYLGSMDLEMNIEAVRRFCADLLPRIRRQLEHTRVKFLVIGREPSPEIRALAQSVPDVTVSGTVPDVAPWLQKVDILVCPLRMGAGTKLKVAEGLASGLPVVGSSLALAGLPGRPGEDYISADTDDSFVEAVCGLARAPQARHALGRQARALAVARLDWRAIVGRLADDMKEALARG